MCINDACSFGRPSPLRGMGRLFISAPETQSTWNTKELSQHSQDKDDPGCMADLQSWHFKREIPFECWWHNTTIRLQGGRKFPKVEKLQGLYLEKTLQDICLYKSWGHVRAVWLWWRALADSAQNSSVGASARAAGSPRGWIAKELTQRPGDSALCLPDLSCASTQVTGPGLWVARKDRQMVDHLRDKHPWLLAMVTCFRFIPWK